MITTTNPHVRKVAPLKLSDGSTIPMPDEFVSIVPAGYEVVCAAWDCSHASIPTTRPLRLEGSLVDVKRQLRSRGWREVGAGAWHCPTHAAMRRKES